MHFFTSSWATAIVLFFSTARSTAIPLFCLTDYDASVVANNYAQLLSNFSVSLATAVLSNDFIDQSDSANTLIDSGTQLPFPLGTLTFSSKAQLIALQGTQANIPFQILNTWHTCDTVMIRWVSKLAPQQVQGINVLQVTPQTNLLNILRYGLYQIKVNYGEFNSGAWLQDIGCTVSGCPAH